MLDFKPFDLSKKDEYNRFLLTDIQRGCEYSFTNLYLWGRQRAAFYKDSLIFFSQFNQKSVYLFPLTFGDIRTAVDAIIADAAQRDIPCRITGLTHENADLLQQLYPGQFRYHFDRNSFDYIYAIDDLAELKGRRFQKKRNHLNRFRQENPDCVVELLNEDNLSCAKQMADRWYALHLQENPHGDYQMEQAALSKAFRDFSALDLEGLLLRKNGEVIAFTLGSFLSTDTFDVHFEKALDRVDGSYAAINRSFAAYLREKYPQLRWLNREEDMGIEGLRKAKLSYCPDHMIEKNWACLLECDNEY